MPALQHGACPEAHAPRAAQILYGNLAPEGSVAKITGKEGLRFRGPARVFDSEEDMLAVVAEDPQQLKVRQHLLVLPMKLG